MGKKKKDNDERLVVPQEPEDENRVEEDDSVDVAEDEIEVNDPGDCIGHWAVCEECEMCEIQDSCKAMTDEINGGDENAEKEQ